MRKLNQGLLLWLLLGVLPRWATGEESSFYFRHQRCELPRDPAHEEKVGFTPVGMCINALANQSILYSSERYFSDIRRAEGHLSLHSGYFQSFYLSGSIARLASPREDKIPLTIEKDLKEASYTLGNVTLFPLSITLGKQSPAFGINHTPVHTINPLLASRETLGQLWSLAEPGLIVRLDNLRRWSFESSYNRNDRGDTRSAAARFMYDLPFKVGVRTVFSFQGEPSGARTGGLGFVSTSPRGNIFQVEWVRGRTTPDGKEDPFRQIIRLSFEEPIYDPSSSYIIFEEIRAVSRQLTIGSRLRFWNTLQALSSATYQKKQDLKQEWFLGLGVGIVL